MTIVRAAITALLACCLAALLAPACGDDDGGDSSLTNIVVRERDGVRLSIAAGSDPFGVGETVGLRAEVENISGGDVLYGSDARVSEDPALQIFLFTELTGSRALPAVATAFETGGTLVPGAKLAVEVAWDQVLDMYQTPQQAPEGSYSATAHIFVKAPDAADPAEVTAAVEFALVGGEKVVLPYQAIAGALVQEEVKAWFEGRGGTVACAYGDRGLFYNADAASGNVAESFDFVYQAQVLNGAPICAPVTEGDTWRVIFSHATGAEPTRVSAFLDVHTGEFIRLEEGGPLPGTSGG